MKAFWMEIFDCEGPIIRFKQRRKRKEREAKAKLFSRNNDDQVGNTKQQDVNNIQGTADVISIHS